MIIRIVISASLILAGLAQVAVIQAAEIQGAGATFPALLYSKWAETYTFKKNIKVNYTPVGSGEGIRRIKSGEVDFGGTDMPLPPDELHANGLLQYPMVMGAITPVIHVPGVFIAQLKLDGETLAAIFMGKIKRWNDPALAALNPSLHLPNLPIVVVRREDKSGTTFNFTNYLSKVSLPWRMNIGEGLEVKWPVGISAKGNSGVSKTVREVVGAIGYVDYADAMDKHLDYVQLKNHDGYYVRPNAGSTLAAAASSKWDVNSGYYNILTDASGETSWPIAATTFILVRKTQQDPDKLRQILKFLEYSYQYGELSAMYLDFVMMPERLRQEIRESWKTLHVSSEKIALQKSVR